MLVVDVDVDVKAPGLKLGISGTEPSFKPHQLAGLGVSAIMLRHGKGGKKGRTWNPYLSSNLLVR